MIFDQASDEIRERFSESTSILNHVRSLAPDNIQTVDDTEKALRGLCLVSIYAAFERSTNAIIEAALAELTNHQTPSTAFIPSLHGLLHYPKLKSLRDCGAGSIFDKSTELFGAAFATEVASFADNPLAERMQNVDGGTVEWLAGLFGITDYRCSAANKGRLINLRERRNAVAHGRESASNVGSRFNIPELSNMYNAADEEITRFLLAMRNQCSEGLYRRRAA